MHVPALQNMTRKPKKDLHEKNGCNNETFAAQNQEADILCCYQMQFHIKVKHSCFAIFKFVVAIIMSRFQVKSHYLRLRSILPHYVTLYILFKAIHNWYNIVAMHRANFHGRMMCMSKHKLAYLIGT